MQPGFTIEGDRLIITLNPQVYSLDMAYATAYIHLDTMWFLFDGDPANEIIITATRKQPNFNLDSFGRQFLNEIISISNYFRQLDINRDVINLVLGKALFSANPHVQREAEHQHIEKILTEVSHDIADPLPPPLQP